MRLAIVINTNDPETAWNALRLAHLAVKEGDIVTVFLFGQGVELEKIRSDKFGVQDVLKQFIAAGGEMLACGTCLKSRGQEGSQTCLVSNLESLYKLMKESDKILTF